MNTNSLEKNKANEYKSLCLNANAIAKNKFGAKAPQGYEVVNSKYDKNSNFKGVLYKKGEEYVFCFVGTERLSGKDHVANLKMGLFGESQQMSQANNYFKDVIYNNDIDPNNVTIIGHSEGGTEATFVGIKNNVKTVTFNAYGLDKKLIDKDKNYDELVTNFRDAHDPVSKMKGNVGKTYIVPNTSNAFLSKTPFGSVKAHGIDNMGDCNVAEPIEDYKKQNTFFLDKISDAEITNEDIKNMENELFSAYEPEINERLKTNRMISNAQANQKVNSGGLIYVNGYTRDDGVEVSGYYRKPAIV